MGHVPSCSTRALKRDILPPGVRKLGLCHCPHLMPAQPCLKVLCQGRAEAWGSVGFSVLAVVAAQRWTGTYPGKRPGSHKTVLHGSGWIGVGTMARGAFQGVCVPPGHPERS